MTPAKDPLSAFDGIRLLVVGDLMLDQYTWGDVTRISPEAPVMVLQAEEEEVRLGGAASVAALLAGLGIHATVAGVIGDDPAGRIVQHLLAERHTRKLGSSREAPLGKRTIAMRPPHKKCRRTKQDSSQPSETSQAATAISRRDLCLVDPTRPTTLKQRLLGRAANRHPHQVIRLDRECRRPLEQSLEKRLLSLVARELPHCQAVLISDYAKGVCTPALVANVIHRSREAGIPVLVDPARGSDFEKYRGATLIKANRHEAQSALGTPILHQRHALAAARELCRRWGFRSAVVTLDRDGVVFGGAKGVCRHREAQVREVCDVTGAGDTVLAVLGACLAAKVTLPEAVSWANAAAMLQIQRIGVSPITREELQQALAHTVPSRKETPRAAHNADGAAPIPRHAPRLRHAPSKVASIDELLAWADDVRRSGLRIALTNGCFDLLHVGHLKCINQAAEFADVLVVAVNSDRSIRRLKGDGRPIINEANRAAMVAALEAVDRVVVLDADGPCELLRRLKPDVLVKGGDYRPEEVVGREIVEGYGGLVRLADHVRDVSTSQILQSLPPR